METEAFIPKLSIASLVKRSALPLAGVCLLMCPEFFLHYHLIVQLGLHSPKAGGNFILPAETLELGLTWTKPTISSVYVLSYLHYVLQMPFYRMKYKPILTEY